jgi:hypothetical protein
MNYEILSINNIIMGNVLSICLSVKKNREKKKKKITGTKITCCCSKSDVREIYDEISIEDVEI